MTELRPTVIIDTREQVPLPITAYLIIRATLTTGDYSFRGGERLPSIERKSVADLGKAFERARFTRELERLRGFPFARLLVIGTVDQIELGMYRSTASPKAILHSLWSIEAKFVPVVFAASPQAGAELVERWCYWSACAAVLAAPVPRAVEFSEPHRQLGE
jgi:ERCC4-type nuclease